MGKGDFFRSHEATAVRLDRDVTTLKPCKARGFPRDPDAWKSERAKDMSVVSLGSHRLGSSGHLKTMPREFNQLWLWLEGFEKYGNVSLRVPRVSPPPLFKE